jgi:hypothetical protein
MKRSSIGALLLAIASIGILVLGSASASAAVFTIPGSHLLSDSEFGSAAWGPGTLTGRAAGPGSSVDFSFTGLATGGTAVEDNFPVASVYGQTGGAYNSNFSNYAGYAMQVKNLDDAPVWIQIYINTGWTNPDTTADTYWEMPSWKYLNAGETAIVVLDFNYAEAYNIGDNSSPHTTGSNGDTLAINAYDRTQVTSIGFQVADFNGTNANATIRINPPDAIGVDPSTLRCLNVADPCDTVDVVFTRVDATPVRGFSATFQLSGELALCGGLTASVREGTYLSGAGGTHYEVADNGSGSYTVDCAIMGLPCGAVGDGTLFTIDVKGSGTGEATGTITVTSVTVRDCSNAPVPAFPGAASSITVDYTAPTAVSDLAATQQKTLNDGDGTTKIALTFTAPVSASVIEVYRAGYGNYPEYDDLPGAGSVPAIPGYPPSSPWALTGVVASGGSDEVAGRDFWYYVVFTKDACGNISSVSNMTGGTLNYHLGDVTTPAGGGDNLVNSIDISLLGTNYWKVLTSPDPLSYLDVGPTSDFSVNGLPKTDNRIQFEDLMMFSINFMQVSLLASPAPVNEQPRLVLRVDEPALATNGIVTARLVLDGNTATVKGLHAAVKFDAAGLTPGEITRGSLLDGQAVPVFFETLGEHGVVNLDLAALGTSQALRGSGEVAVLTFSAAGGVASHLRLAGVEMRDRENGPVGLAVTPVKGADETTGSAAQVGLRLEARPNPFAGSTDLAFSLPSAANVSLKVYDVKGQLVATVVDAEFGAGEHKVSWSCRDSNRGVVAPGVYVAVLRAGDNSIKQKLSLLP